MRTTVTHSLTRKPSRMFGRMKLAGFQTYLNAFTDGARAGVGLYTGRRPSFSVGFLQKSLTRAWEARPAVMEIIAREGMTADAETLHGIGYEIGKTLAVWEMKTAHRGKLSRAIDMKRGASDELTERESQEFRAGIVEGLLKEAMRRTDSALYPCVTLVHYAHVQAGRSEDVLAQMILQRGGKLASVDFMDAGEKLGRDLAPTVLKRTDKAQQIEDELNRVYEVPTSYRM